MSDFFAEFLAPADVAQVLILYGVFYWVLRAARGSRFGQVLTGVGVLFGAMTAFTHVFNFSVLTRLLQYLLVYLALSTVVIFQPEIRRILATLGALFFRERGREMTNAVANTLVDALFRLGERRMGALLAIERGISLRGYEMSGVALDALISSELFVSVFTEPLPLHDGGGVIRNGRLAAAHCVFPVSRQGELSESGMRHRAAVGMSEETDALVLVVSEETGRVSVAYNGRLIRYPDLGAGSRAAVLRWVLRAIPHEQSPTERLAAWTRTQFDRIFSREPKKAAEPPRADDGSERATA